MRWNSARVMGAEPSWIRRSAEKSSAASSASSLITRANMVGNDVTVVTRHAASAWM